MSRAAILIAVGTWTATAAAEPTDGSLTLARDARKDLDEGNLLPGVTGARHDRPEVRVEASAGRDTSTGTTTFGTALEATLTDRLALRSTFANDGYDPKLRPTVGFTFDVLRQGEAPVDVSLGVAYADQDYNQVGGVLVRVAIGRRIGATMLVTNLEYGAGLAQGERYGALGVGAIRPLARDLYAGVSTVAHLDLELDDAEPAEERTWDVQGGPVVGYALGPVVVRATAGVAAWQFRQHPDAHVGAVGLLGGAMVF